jgi:hypothetical protein
MIYENLFRGSLSSVSGFKSKEAGKISRIARVALGISSIGVGAYWAITGVYDFINGNTSEPIVHRNATSSDLTEQAPDATENSKDTNLLATSEQIVFKTHVQCNKKDWNEELISHEKYIAKCPGGLDLIRSIEPFTIRCASSQEFPGRNWNMAQTNLNRREISICPPYAFPVRDLLFEIFNLRKATQMKSFFENPCQSSSSPREFSDNILKMEYQSEMNLLEFGRGCDPEGGSLVDEQRKRELLGKDPQKDWSTVDKFLNSMRGSIHHDIQYQNQWARRCL